MNVNLWGPDLWSLLHGIAGLAKNPSKIELDNIEIIFKELCILLPCIHCKRSYNDFYIYLNIRKQFARGDGIKCVYDIHSLVDDKLEKQKLNLLLSNLKLFLNQEEFQTSLKILTTRPSLQVVQKRFELSEGMPFREQSIWRVLFAFVLCIDNEDELDAQKRRQSLSKFITALSLFLQSSLQYKIIAKKLSFINIQDNFSSKEAFENIALARESIQKNSFDDVWINELWKIYIGNMPAGTCGTFTCS
jgi:hypothetical protein